MKEKSLRPGERHFGVPFMPVTITSIRPSTSDPVTAEKDPSEKRQGNPKAKKRYHI